MRVADGYTWMAKHTNQLLKFDIAFSAKEIDTTFKPNPRTNLHKKGHMCPMCIYLF